LVPWVGVSEWSTFQGNSAHTGFVPVDLDPTQFAVRWQLAIGNGLSTGSVWGMNLNTITLQGGRFFVASGTTLSARREYDSGLEWQYDFSALAFPSVNPPAVGGGMVYIAAGQQSATTLFGFEASSGSVAFRSPMSSQWEHYLAPTIGAQGVYTNAGTYGGLYAFKTSGEQRFIAQAAQTDMWTPAVDATAVYVYTGSLSMFDPVTGTSLGSIADPTFTNYVYSMNGAPVLGAPGSVFAANYVNAHIGGHKNTLLGFDTSSKTIRWQVSGQYPTTPAYATGVLYVANNGPFRLEARAESDGALLWSWTPPDAAESSFFSEVLLTNNLVFVSTDRSTYAIDRQTHQSVWKYPVSANLALSRSGILYLEGLTTLTALNVK
jgi:outer membrane protein assembly factor BamB